MRTLLQTSQLAEAAAANDGDVSWQIWHQEPYPENKEKVRIYLLVCRRVAKNLEVFTDFKSHG